MSKARNALDVSSTVTSGPSPSALGEQCAGPAPGVLDDLRARAVAASALAQSLNSIVLALEETGRSDDVACAAAFREIDPALLLSLPDEQALAALERLYIAILTVEAWKQAR